MTRPVPFLMTGIFAVVLVACVVHKAAAADLRHVTEPKIPAACMSLIGTGGDETAVLQKALNSCGKGKAVHLASGNFISGPLTIPSGVGLWIDSGAVLKASSNAKLFDKGRNICGTVSKEYNGCNPLISMMNVVGSGIYGKGKIDGQGGIKLTGKSQSWWDLAHEAQVKNEYQNNPTLIEIDASRDITLYQVAINNAPNYHVIINQSNGTTIWGVSLYTPASARNTDGIDPSGSQNITIAHSSISTGDDNIAIKAGRGPSRYISVTNNHFGAGHGMSIGSETNAGVSHVTVTTLTQQNSLNGLQIKSDRSKGGLVTDISYTDVCLRNVTNPIVLNTEYSKTATGNLIPVYKDIIFHNIRVLTPGKFTFDGFSDDKPIQVTLKNVVITKGSIWVTKHANITGKYVEEAISSSLHC
ncbi:endo-polygalacturonase-like [Bacillus rossius redtenbacheri]|uniref:endo-polygalacturonase-like n=1 Tax=Bacillus rossius redtenbacheri TaxID=93214 RepID=UPI002FDE308F